MKLLPFVLLICAGCAADLTMLVSDDAAVGDAMVVDHDAGPDLRDDGAVMDDDAGVIVDGDSGVVDAGVTGPVDSGALVDSGLPGDAGSSSSAVCGDGYIDPPEVCDRGDLYPDGGRPYYTPGSDCADCRIRNCDPWAVDDPTARCVGRTDSAGVWGERCGSGAWLLQWSSAAERDRVLATLRAHLLSTGMGTTGVIGLRRVSATAPWVWRDRDGLTRVATDLPPWRSPPSPGQDCALLQLSDERPVLIGWSCSTSAHNFCSAPPPGIPR